MRNGFEIHHQGDLKCEMDWSNKTRKTLFRLAAANLRKECTPGAPAFPLNKYAVCEKPGEGTGESSVSSEKTEADQQRAKRLALQRQESQRLEDDPNSWPERSFEKGGPKDNLPLISCQTGYI